MSQLKKARLHADHLLTQIITAFFSPWKITIQKGYLGSAYFDAVIFSFV